jgi:hypothetical protein
MLKNALKSFQEPSCLSFEQKFNISKNFLPPPLGNDDSRNDENRDSPQNIFLHKVDTVGCMKKLYQF